MIKPEDNTAPMPAYVDDLQQIWSYDQNAVTMFFHKSYSYTDPAIGHTLLWRGKRMPARMPHLRGASGAVRVCGNMEHRARLSRNPRKNLLPSVNYLTLLDRFLNDAA